MARGPLVPSPLLSLQERGVEWVTRRSWTRRPGLGGDSNMTRFQIVRVSVSDLEVQQAVAGPGGVGQISQSRFSQRV